MKLSTTTRRTRAGEKGYVLIAVMLLMTLMIIAMSIEIPRIAQQVKREKEEELVRRGKEYATAIKRYYHKAGAYPTSLQQLENTNRLRFLRRKYKDPITGDEEWHLVRVGEAQIKIPPPAAGGTLTTGTLTTSPTGQQAPLGAPGGQPGGGPPGQQNPPGKLGTLTTSNIGNGQTAGGGFIIGVASNSKGEGIKEFNDTNHYNEWLFVYDPRLEQANGNGITVAAPSGVSGAAGATGLPPGTLGPPPTGTPPPNPR